MAVTPVLTSGSVGVTVRPGALHSLSRPASPWTTMCATVLKNLQVARRYVPDLVGRLVEMGIRAVFFLLMANTVSMGSRAALGVDLAGRSLYIFFLGSLVLFVFTRSTLWGPINAVSNDLYNGTLEYLYSNPCSRYAYYVGNVVAEVVLSMAVFIPLLILLVGTAQISAGMVGMVLLASVVVLVALTAMGILIALLALLWRQVGSLASVLGILFEMLAGAYIPVTSFPPLAQYPAYLLPYTWGYDLIRYYSFAGQWHTLLPVWQEWAVIVAYAVLYTVVSRYLLSRAEQRAKRSGLHII
jgi:ABC-2 type transport system permease protein